MISWELPTIAVLIRMHCSSRSYPLVGLSPVGYILLVIVLFKTFRTFQQLYSKRYRANSQWQSLNPFQNIKNGVILVFLSENWLFSILVLYKSGLWIADLWPTYNERSCQNSIRFQMEKWRYSCLIVTQTKV